MAIAKKRIAVDVDDVLALSAEDFVAYCNERWDTKLTVEDYDEDWGKLWGVSLEEAESRAREFLTSGSMSNYAHHEDAVRVLRKLKDDYDLVVITSRDRLLTRETRDWVDQYFEGIFSDIHHAGIWDGDRSDEMIKMTKADICKEVGADYLIDDQLKHCLAVASAGIPSLLFGDYTWNQLKDLPSDVHRVMSWDDVYGFFQDHEK